MMDENSRSSVEGVVLERGVRAVRMRNSRISIDILPDKGADIYSIVDARTGVDVLWKSHIGLRPPGHGVLSRDSATAWLEQYEGGWQEILPNAGGENVYKGVTLSFHGESTLLPWDVHILKQSGDEAIVDFSCRLYRSPFLLERRMRLGANDAHFTLHERVVNLADEDMDFMWGHHPAFGAPFISEHTRVCTNARRVYTDEQNNGPLCPLQPNVYSEWPYAATRTGEPLDLRRLPPTGERTARMAYLFDFDGPPWYALLNPQLNLAAAVKWSGNVFKHLWMWQEFNASTGFPFYGRSYTMALEPHSSYPHELGHVMNTTRTQLTLAAGAALDASLTFALFDPRDAITLNAENLDKTIGW
ncbi:MAG: aldose 1-epimerase [Chloroflexi bacterium]|nr:aldose 1-epimerase [Chloroflexota bacterium]